jgi:predicted membrane GTPase involved in stress response
MHLQGVKHESNKEAVAGKIVELTGLDRKEVDKAMKALKADGAIESPKMCYWQPK